MAKYDGQYNSPGAPGNGAAVAGGIRLRDLLPSASWDIPQQAPGQKPRYLKPGEKPPLRDLFPRQPGSFADPFNPGIPAGGVSFSAPGNGGALAQRVYGQIERGQYNRPGPRGAGIVQPEVFMAPYPGTKPGQPTEFFPLGNPAAGYRFEAARPGPNALLAQASPGDIGNVAGMQAASDATLGYFPGPMETPGAMGIPGPIETPGPMGIPGPMMQMGPTEQQMKQQEILAARNAQRAAILESPVNYKKPFNVDINATSQGLESIGAGGTIVLDPSQRLKMGGTYTPGYTEEGVPISQGYKLEAGYETPGFGLNVNYRDSRGRMGGGGFGGQMNLRGTW